jgi:hypothetical protein
MGSDPKKLRLPTPAQALPGRAERMPVAPRHVVTKPCIRLQKKPEGYCGIGGTGVSCPIGVGG